MTILTSTYWPCMRSIVTDKLSTPLESKAFCLLHFRASTSRLFEVRSRAYRRQVSLWMERNRLRSRSSKNSLKRYSRLQPMPETLRSYVWKKAKAIGSNSARGSGVLGEAMIYVGTATGGVDSRRCTQRYMSIQNSTIVIWVAMMRSITASWISYFLLNIDIRDVRSII